MMESKHIKIRRAGMDDVTDISVLSHQLGYPASGAEIGERLAIILNSRDYAVYVADRSDGEVIGYIYVRVCHSIQSGPFAEISGFVVSEAFRGKGIGKDLLKAVEDWTMQKEIPKLRVRPQVHRSDAKAFYSGQGFLISKQQCVFDKRMNSGE